MAKPLSPIPWRSVVTLAVAAAVGVGVVVWVRGMGGPAAVRAEFGVWAPLVSVPLHIATTLTPVGELIPFGVANGSLYGVAVGAGLNLFAWMVAAAMQYTWGRRAAVGAGAASGLPGWLGRLPLAHPAVLAMGRWLPGGGPLVDAAAGAAGVPFGRAMAWAAVGHAPQAVVIAAVGAALVG